MKKYLIVLALFASACGGSSLSAPTIAAPTKPLALAGQSNALFIRPFLISAAAPEAVIGFSQDGSSIEQWAPGSAYWGQLAPQFHQPLRAFVWWQGEGNRLTPDIYASQLRDLIGRVRAEANDPNLLVLICRVVDDPLFVGIRAAQAAYVASDPRSILVNSDNLPKEFGEGVGSAHLSPDGYTLMAKRILAVLP